MAEVFAAAYTGTLKKVKIATADYLAFVTQLLFNEFSHITKVTRK